VEVPSSTTARTSNEDSKMDAISSLPPFTKFRVLHVDPLALAIDDFFAHEECDRYVEISAAPNEKGKDDPFQTRSIWQLVRMHWRNTNELVSTYYLVPPL
jgi:hypothetical protein